MMTKFVLPLLDIPLPLFFRRGVSFSRPACSCVNWTEMQCCLTVEILLTNRSLANIEMLKSAWICVGKMLKPGSCTPKVLAHLRHLRTWVEKFESLKCVTWIPWNLSFRHILFHEKSHFMILTGSAFYQIWLGWFPLCPPYSYLAKCTSC